jgi:phosphoglycolate phosphatase
MKHYETVIWDWNGTLLDDVALALAIVNEILVEYGVPSLTSERYREIFDFPVRLYYERAGLDLTLISFETVSEAFCSRFEERLYLAQLFPSARRVLETMRQSGIRQFVLSSTEHQALLRMLKRFGLADIFDGVKGMQNGLAAGKLTGGRELLSRFHIDPRNAVLIGDTLHDAEVAESLGVDCLLISSGHHSHERLSKLKYPVFSSLDALSQ